MRKQSKWRLNGKVMERYYIRDVSHPSVGGDEGKTHHQWQPVGEEDKGRESNAREDWALADADSVENFLVMSPGKAVQY